MRTLSRTTTAAAAVLAVLALAACGGDDGDGGGGGGNDLSYEDSPLAKYFGDIGGQNEMSEEEAQAQAEEQNRKVEELTASCMSEQGFDYTPVDHSGTTFVSFGETAEDPIENAEQNGYYIFTTWDEGDANPEEVFVDPNQEYVEAMSESERAAYEEALYGTPPEWDENTTTEEMEDYDWSTAGCSGAAQHEVYEVDSEYAGIQKVYEDPQFAELVEAMNTLYTDPQSDPAMTEVNTAWSECMADAGHPDLADPMAAQNSINDLQNALWEANADDPEYMGPQGAELQKLKDQEIETAVADYTCQKDVDYLDKQLQLQFDREQAFVDEHKADLEAFAAALEAASA